MALSKDTYCHGVEPFNFRDTGDTIATITANVGQSTAIGPKVAISRKKTFQERNDVVAVDMGGGKSSSNFDINPSPTIACTHHGAPVIGTIDASIYRKNSNQDNSKYIIRKTQKEKSMEKATPGEIIEQAIGKGKDVVGIINLSEALLRIVEGGTLTMTETLDALCSLRESLAKNGDEGYSSMAEAIKDINADAPHQQDQLNCQDDAARTLAASTHGTASHLTKTVVEGEDESGEEKCVVRRLTPTETSRLQGFPDNYTNIDGVETADAPQFKAHGNSWATPCANFVSTRIEMELRRLGHDGTIRYATCCSGIEAHSVAVRNLDWKAVFFSEIEPFPCRVLAKHYPDVPNLGDMTQIHFDVDVGAISNAHRKGEEYSLPKEFKEAAIQEIPFKVGELEVFSGGTPCFVAGTMVLTEKGYKPIEDVKVGEMVMTHLGRLRKVVATGSKKADNIVAVTTSSRQPILCTSDHKFWAAINPHQDFRRKSDSYLKVLFDGIEFKEIEKVGVGGFVSQLNTYDLGQEEVYVPQIYNASPMDVIELAGWYVGDGHCRKWIGKNKKALILSLCKSKVDKFELTFKDKIVYKVAKHGNEGVYRITICNTELCDWLMANFGEKSFEKTIPAWIVGGGSEIRNHFTKGYMATDGYSKPKNHIEKGASTTSKSLAFGLADLFGRSCVCESKTAPTKKMYDGRVVNQKTFWTVKRHTNPNRFHKYGMWDMVRVLKIEPQAPNTVYNITVEEDHSYVVNGLCVKNCQDISVAGKRKGMAEGSESRSSLAFHFQRIIDETKTTFCLWENVPGAFSSNGGADFIWFVNRCAESGYAMAWRVLDAQYTMTEEFPRAVPQRRRRIWLVGYRGNDWRVPSRIVFESEKALAANPPDRVPRIGFTSIADGVDVDAIRKTNEKKDETKNGDGFLDLFASVDDDSPKAKKVSQMIPLDEMPDEADFSKLPMVSIYEFAKKVGEPGYLGSVFRTDKKTANDAFKAAPEYKDDEEWLDSEEAQKLFASFKEQEKAGELQWEGAEKISPQALEAIGNAGVLANGRILTMTCHEWTSGIQLSPKTYSAWEVVMQHMDWLKANALLPEAYDETVCGLSEVLEDNPDEKYNLSWRACFGILRRAETRGKELPEALHIALISTIRENAGIVKWVALNGKDTKKKETDFSEKESARICFDRYISQVAKFEDVVPAQPKRKSTDESDADELEDSDEEYDGEVDEDGNPIDTEGFKEVLPCGPSRVEIQKEEIPDMPNGVVNVSGGETAATLIASGDAAVGTTQDANVIALKKEGQFQKTEEAN